MIEQSLHPVAGVLLDTLFPLLVFCAAGALADRFLELDLKTLSRVAIYIFTAPLLFVSLLRVEVSAGQVIQVTGFVSIILVAMAGLGFFYSNLLSLDRSTRSSAVLASTFFNAINLGFPFLLLAFGDQGLALGSVLVAVIAIPHNGFGLFVAARSVLSTKEALLAIAKLPVLHAAALALICRLSSITPPSFLLNPAEMMAQAAIPLIPVIVGMELRRIGLKRPDRGVAGIVVLRLIAAPAIALLAAELVGLEGLLRKVVVLQASMPCAIFPIIYARSFGSNVSFISQAVLYSTLLGFFSLPLVMLLLG